MKYRNNNNKNLIDHETYYGRWRIIFESFEVGQLGNTAISFCPLKLRVPPRYLPVYYILLLSIHTPQWFQNSVSHSALLVSDTAVVSRRCDSDGKFEYIFCYVLVVFRTFYLFEETENLKIGRFVNGAW